MPRQNRVNPFGELISTSSHGLFMGNRGVLHDDQGNLTEKRWTNPHWIICLTEFKGRKQPLMSPGCYTELFFFDEALALAAGHRPCAECRRKAFNHFKQAWVKGNSHLDLPERVGVDTIDKVLHEERVTSDRKKVTYLEELSDLPQGTFVSLTKTPDKAFLIWYGVLWQWTPEGYIEGPKVSPMTKVNVLTPASLVNAMKAGYLPVVAMNKVKTESRP
jgi:hypothetical protein